MNQAFPVALVAAAESSLDGMPASPAGHPSSDPEEISGASSIDREVRREVRRRSREAAGEGRCQGSVSLRGTTRGLEIAISGAPEPAVIGARLAELLAEAPSFFAGSDARVA